MHNLSEFLKTERDKRYMSLRDFAKLTGISHGYLDKLEKGIDCRNNKPIIPTIDTLDKISKATNTSLIELLRISGYIETLSEEDKKLIEEYNVLIKELDVKEIEALQDIKSRGLSLVEVNKALKLLRG